MEDWRGRLALNPNVGKIPHAAAAYLDFLRRLGAPALSTHRPWTPADVQAAADRGPHQSAEAHRDFLWEESVEMCQRRHTLVLPLSVVKKLKRVRVSPPGVIPQRDRRARTVSDLTDAASPMPGVNETTVPLAPADAMQFGQALRRLLFKIYRADPRWG